MSSLTKDSLTALLAPHPPPCLSLYQPTHRHHPERQQNPIRFRNLVKEMEASLVKAHPLWKARWLLRPFEALASDDVFWNHGLDGLVVLGASNLFRVIRLPRPVAALVVVADSFHLKPLWRFLQSVHRYQVLGLSLDGVRLFEGDRDGLEEVELAVGVPRTMNDALGPELASRRASTAFNGAGRIASRAVGHGHRVQDDGGENDAERFFRAVDRAILEHHCRPAGVPLILAALPEHHTRFRSVSHNPFLMREGITVNPNVVDTDVLRELAWQVVAPQYEHRLTRLTNDFERARAAGRGSDNLRRIAEAASAGRVATLFIEADHQIGGQLGEGTGAVVGGALDNPRVGDLLDELGELVGKMGGEVLVLPAASMPTRKGAAAIYRY